MPSIILKLALFSVFLLGIIILLTRAKRGPKRRDHNSSIPLKTELGNISDKMDSATALLVAVARMDSHMNSGGKVSERQQAVIKGHLQTHMQLSEAAAMKKLMHMRNITRDLNRAQSVLPRVSKNLKNQLTKTELDDLIIMLTEVAECDDPMNKDQMEFIARIKDDLSGTQTHPGYHLAQLNIAHFQKPAEDPENKAFHDAIDAVNAVAESEPGFVWRLVDDGPERSGIDMFENPDMLVNLSVWTDMESLMKFVYRTPIHRDIMRRKNEWFEHVEVSMVLWWIKEGDRPTLREAEEKLSLLVKQGPSDEAFTFKHPFPPAA